MIEIGLIAHIIGSIGSAGVCAAYGMTVTNRWSVTSNKALWMNFIAGVLLLLSLLIHFNLGSFLIEIFWIGIAGYGLFKNYRLKTLEGHSESS